MTTIGLANSQKEQLTDLLKNLAPGVFLATSAYCKDEGKFRDNTSARVLKCKLLSIETPAVYNDTQVYVALVEEWDPAYLAGKPAKPSGAKVAVGGIPSARMPDVKLGGGKTGGGSPTTPLSPRDDDTPPRSPGIGEGGKKGYNIVFSFRGTQPWQACDWLADLDYIKVPVAWWPSHDATTINKAPEVHRGFYYSLNSVTEVAKRTSEGCPCQGKEGKFDRSLETQACNPTLDGALLSVLEDFNAEWADDEGFAPLRVDQLTRIVVVGHSLGGALATLASAWTRIKLPHYLPEVKELPVTCITTGCPRVGDYTFMKKYQALLDNPKSQFTAYRIVHNNDVVPSVPFSSWHFYHVGQPIWLQKRLQNWARVYHVYSDPQVYAGLLLNGGGATSDAGLESNARAPGYTLSVMDHFQWRYNSAISLAIANTIPSSVDYLRGDQTLRSILSNTFLLGLFNLLAVMLAPLAFIVVSLGRTTLARLALQAVQNPTVAWFYKLGVNLLFWFFTLPVLVLTYITYYIDG